MSALSSAHDAPNEKYIIFLHNRFIEENPLDAKHPKFGRAEYNEILSEFKQQGFHVISEKRQANTDLKKYANKTVIRINELLKNGVKPSQITIVGTSKGGYIAQYVSSYAKNPELNYVFIGASFQSEMDNFSDLNLSGNILSINEKSDVGAISLKERIKMSNAKISQFKEIELNTGLGHGFLFKPLNEWINPTIQWANGNYAPNEDSKISK